MSDLYSPKDTEPTNLEEAIQYAAYYFWHSGFRAFVGGWCYGSGMKGVEIAELLSMGKDTLNQLAKQGLLDTDFDTR